MLLRYLLPSLHHAYIEPFIETGKGIAARRVESPASYVERVRVDRSNLTSTYDLDPTPQHKPPNLLHFSCSH